MRLSIRPAWDDPSLPDFAPTDPTVSEPPPHSGPRAAVDPVLALAAGELAVLHFGLEGTRFCAVVEGTSAPKASLTQREQRVLRELLSGQFRKEIAVGLGVGASTVSMDVSVALAKVGLKRWEHLVLVSLLLSSPEAQKLTSARSDGTPAPRLHLESSLDLKLLGLLSPAEREVALLVVSGNANSRIAVQRKASVRTVANQVAAVFHKLGVHGRLPLVLTLGSGQPVGTGEPLPEAPGPFVLDAGLGASRFAPLPRSPACAKPSSYPLPAPQSEKPIEVPSTTRNPRPWVDTLSGRP